MTSPTAPPVRKQWDPYQMSNCGTSWNAQDYGPAAYTLSSEAESMELQYWKLDGPIRQPIPDNLIAGDFIEINGFCRGPEVIVELQTEELADLKNTGVLPLRIVLNAGGPVQVMSQNKGKIQKQEQYVKNGIQDGLAFELCIRAFDDGYDIRLNNESVCHVAHLVKLEQVGYIVMDGDADFTSIEFKDVYGEEDDIGYPQDDVQPGFMRVQEMRQSSSRKKTAPILVRSSTRRSQRSNQNRSPAVLAKSQWETSADLSRPELDTDKPKATMSNTYDSDLARTVGSAQVRSVPNQNSMTFDTIRANAEADYGRLKSKPSLGGRKSVNLSGSNLEDQYVVGGAPSNAIAGETHRGSYMTLDDEVNIRGTSQAYAISGYGSVSGSTPNLAEKNKKKRSSWLIGKKKSGGSETDLQGSTVDLEKKKKGSIRDLFKRKKSTPSSSNVDVRQSISMPDVTYPAEITMASARTAERPLYLGAAADKSYVRGPVPDKLVKEPAPNIAAYLAAQKAVPEFENFTLTSQKGMTPDQSRITSKVTPIAAAPMRESTYEEVNGGSQRKLKGTAPELADTILDQGRAKFDHETTLTGNMGDSFGINRSHVAAAPGVYAEPPTASVAKAAPVTYENTPQKIKGTAPEMASKLHEVHGSHAITDNYTLSGISQTPKSKEVIYPKPVIEKVQSKPVNEAIYRESQVERDYSSPRPIQSAQGYETPIQPMPVLVAQKSQPQRSMSAGFRNSDDDLSDVSNIHSDHEFYLDVGRSAYYMERKKSLKRYRSTRTLKREREARRSMGLGNDSQHSSISSLKPGDPVLIARKKIGTDKAGVNSWLNGQESAYAYERRTERTPVYAAPPSVTEPPIDLSLVNDATKIHQENYKAEILTPLKPGRKARILGHFLNPDLSAESCSILLSGPTEKDSTQMLQLWPDASLNVYGFENLRRVLRLQCQSPTTTMESDFVLDVHNRNNKLAITVRDAYSVFVPSNLAPDQLTSISLESSNNAILTQLSISETLSLPLDLKYMMPSADKTELTQSLSLRTKLTACSKTVVLTFTTDEGKTFRVLFDFITDCARVHFPGNDLESESIRHEIPFVPEQIREITVRYETKQSKILVRANKKKILEVCPLSGQSMGPLAKSRIEGDLLLLDAAFE